MLETTIEGARGVILNVTGGKDLTLGQVYEAAHLVQGVVDYSANIIFGANINEALQEEIEITVIATGFVSKGDGAIGDGAPRQNFINLMKEPEQKPEPVKQPEKEVREERIEEIREERPRATYTRVTPANDFRSDEELEDVQPSTDKKSDLPSFMKKLFGKK